MKREHLSSRLGFILITAACSIGLGNVWRFPYITGRYGGASFVLLYILFLVILGLPIVVMEFAVGRASQRSVALSFDVLEPKGSKWHWYKYMAIVGNYLLMMFYTVISGWLVWYFVQMAIGRFQGLATEEVNGVFEGLLASPGTMVICTVVTIGIAVGVCSLGIQKGVERVTKLMMLFLFSLLIVLAVKAILLPGAKEGLRYYLLPDFRAMVENGLPECIFAAMGQAFFTLSIGIGALSVFGSRIDKSSSLTENALYMGGLDTLVALLSGLIIFPACFAFGISPDNGPNLIFITLPNVFNGMAGGRIWGTLFFVFMSFAAFSTILAVFENIISCGMDLFHWSRKKSCLVNLVLITALSLPCVFGYNLWSGFQPLGENSTVLDLEDFLVSNLILPIGSFCYLIFCVTRFGWGFGNYLEEANTGNGIKLPRWIRPYVTFVLPALLLFLIVKGLIGN